MDTTKSIDEYIPSSDYHPFRDIISLLFTTVVGAAFAGAGSRFLYQAGEFAYSAHEEVKKLWGEGRYGDYIYAETFSLVFGGIGALFGVWSLKLGYETFTRIWDNPHSQYSRIGKLETQLHELNALNRRVTKLEDPREK